MSWNVILCLWLLRIWFIFVLSLALKYSKKRLEIRGGSRTVWCGGQWVKLIYVKLKELLLIAKHASDITTQTSKLEWLMILKISFRAKAGVPKTLVKEKLRLHSLYFPQNTLMLTESHEEFSDLHSIFRLCTLRYCSFLILLALYLFT